MHSRCSSRPAAGYVLAFYVHYMRPFWPTSCCIVGSVRGHRAHRGVAVRLRRQPGRLLMKADRADLLADHGRFLAVHGRLVLLVLPVAAIPLRICRAPGPARQLRHAYALAGAPLRAAPAGLLPERLRRPGRQQGHADGAGACASRREDDRRHLVRRPSIGRRAVLFAADATGACCCR